VDDAAVRRSLLAWYRREARDLPWRRTRDPYTIWVSEIMLQQTRVDVATPYFLRWMDRFPTVQALAKADLEEVLQAWSGLGYYSRARNLHAAACVVAKEGFPDSTEALRGLPGVGEYTSGAVASIAFGERVPAVDGNVVRVLARLNGWSGAASDATLKAKVGEAAARLVPKASPGDWNQALMDLGATVCTPRTPRCDVCPVAKHCVAKAAGVQDSIPAPKRQAKPRVERRAYAVVEHGGKVLLVRNPAEGLLAGLWSLPGGLADRPLAELVLEQSGVAVTVPSKATAASVRHQFSHRTWEMDVRRANVKARPGKPAEGSALGSDLRPRPGTAWVPLEELEGQALPAAMRSALAVVGVGPARRPAGGRKPKRFQGSGPS
jgi:A/G-specific adenine glycosylase